MIKLLTEQSIRRLFLNQPAPSQRAAGTNERSRVRFAVGCALAVFAASSLAPAQVLTIDTSGLAHQTANGPVDVRYSQITPTHVDLSKQELDNRTRLMLIRALQSEQGFAMRPFPHGHKGLTLEANGKLSPAGEAYLDMATTNGISAKPGDRLVISNVNIDRDKIVFDLNGGPDPKHRFLRHVQVGMGDPSMTQPVVQDDGQQATGSRLTLEFHGHVPEMTASDVEALLKPLISFNVETPVEAFTNTLPTPLKKAILDHEVWVGMTQDMVQFAKGQPDNKWREVEGQTPIVSWIYGKPPDTVEFVRFNGNRVIRVEIAPIGKPMEVYTTDMVTPLMMGRPLPEVAESTRQPVKEGDVQRNPETQAPAPPPSLRQPGEKLPEDTDKNAGVMRPVYFPKDTQDDSTQLGQNPDTQPPAAPSSSAQPATSSGSQAAPASGAKPAPANGSQQSAPSNTQPTPADASQPQPKPPAQEQLIASGRAN